LVGAAAITVALFFVPWGILANAFGSGFSFTANLLGPVVSGLGAGLDWVGRGMTAFVRGVQYLWMVPAGLIGLAPVLRIPVCMLMVFGIIFQACRCINKTGSWDLLFLLLVLFPCFGIPIFVAPSLAKDPYFSQWVVGHDVSEHRSWEAIVDRTGSYWQTLDKNACSVRREATLVSSAAYTLTIDGKPAATTQCGMLNRMEWTPKKSGS